jgi:hypothetical protein
MAKEYVRMARPKSTSGKNTRTSKTQPGATAPASTPVEKSVPAAIVEPTEVKPEIKTSPEIRQDSKPKIERDLKPEVRVETKMFELRRTDSRKNVVPINLEDEVRRRAYELYQQRDPWAGGEAEDWFNAEREILQRYRQQSA